MDRGFDKLMTPMGLNVVVLSLFLFFIVIAVGGVAWKLLERAAREKHSK